jgi:hypothetical protein
MFFKEAIFLTLLQLTSLSMVAPLNSIPHGRHSCCFLGDKILMFSTRNFMWCGGAWEVVFLGVIYDESLSAAKFIGSGAKRPLVPLS